MGGSDAPTVPAAPDFSNPPVLLWLMASPKLWRAESTLPNSSSFNHCGCHPVTQQAGALPARQKSWSPGPIAEHGTEGVMTANQINCVSRFISNHSVQGLKCPRIWSAYQINLDYNGEVESIALCLVFTLSQRQVLKKRDVKSLYKFRNTDMSQDRYCLEEQPANSSPQQHLSSSPPGSQTRSLSPAQLPLY